MATQVRYPLLMAEAFLDIDFGKHKAALDNGVIRMMAGCLDLSSLPITLPPNEIFAR